jgi:phospholipid/cholesterol/gamma-HCH transport system substrate-binding protein
MNNLHLKVGIFIAAVLLLLTGFVVYLLHARGFFEITHTLTLAAGDAGTLSPGMPVTYQGIPIGEVKAIALNDAGEVRAEVKYPNRHARWYRDNSRFLLEKPLVGAAKIRLVNDSGAGARLPADALRALGGNDQNQDIAEAVERVKKILDNVEAMTGPDSSINQSLANVNTVTDRMAGDYGVMSGVLGSDDKARVLTDTLERARALVARLDGVAAKADGMALKADQWLFADGGVAPNSKAAVEDMRRLLAQVGESLKKVDATLANVQGISADVKGGTEDLARLRAEVDDTVRKVNGLVTDLNRKWPFKRGDEVVLP